MPPEEADRNARYVFNTLAEELNAQEQSTEQNDRSDGDYAVLHPSLCGGAFPI
jgi:hypothetical protein